jgi:hypothetical protein
MGSVLKLTWFGGTGDWSDAADWSPALANETPGYGFTVYIRGGDVVLSPSDAAGSYGTLSGQTIYLGSNVIANPATFDTSDVAVDFATTVNVGGNYPYANWIARGATSFDGVLNLEGAGQLGLQAVADQASNPGVFTLGTGGAYGALNIGSEAQFTFTAGVFVVGGGASFSIDGSATFALGALLEGAIPGGVQLMQSGTLDIGGAATGYVSFAGAGATLRLENPWLFQGTITGFDSGDSIELSNIVANQASYNTGTGALTLRYNGTTVETLNISGANGLGSNSFQVTNDGSTTTVTLSGPTTSADILPVAVFAKPGAQVSLASILTAAFGSTSGFNQGVYVSYDGAARLANDHWEYWTGTSGTLTSWSVPGNNTTPLTPSTTLGALVTSADFADTYLNVGNVIKTSADIKVPVAWNNGVVTHYIEYQINVVDPALEGSSAASLTEPTPREIVQSAINYDSFYGDGVVGTPQSEDCQSIAQDVAAAVGATHGGNDINPDTNAVQTANLNQPDGFWRIVYDGGEVAAPTKNWFSLLQPGDIVRIGWNPNKTGAITGHTTTVLSVAPDASSITVYDNTDYGSTNLVDGGALGSIGIHTVQASSWENSADPAYITVYRLTADGRYMVDTQTSNQTVYGTVYKDDFVLVGPGDTIYGGAGKEMIEGPSADLHGVTLINAHVGDFFQFDDAASIGATFYDQATGVLTVAYDVAGGGYGVAQIHLPAGMAASFGVSYATEGSGVVVTIEAAPRDNFYGDGASDVLWQEQSTGQTYEWRITNGNLVSYASFGQLGGWEIVGSGDFTGNGVSDILWQNQATGDVYEWMMSNGQPSGSAYLGNLTGWNEIGVGAFQGAGTDDLLWQNQSTGDVYEWQMSSGQHVGNDIYLGNLSGWSEIGVGDFTGNGTSDLLWQNQSTGDVYEWTMSNGRQTGSIYLGNLAGWSEIGVGDFQGNGTSDLLWQNQSTGDVYEWTMSNGQHTGDDVYLGALSGWQVAGIGDYRGNGVDGVLWQNQANGDVWEWTMAGGQHVTGIDVFLGNFSAKSWRSA